MSRVTPKKVADAVGELTSQGKVASVRNVRALLGGGSFRDISRQMAALKTKQPLPRVPTEIPSAPGYISLAEHQQKLRELEARFEGDRKRLMMETDAIRQGIGSPFQGRISSLEKQVASLQKELGRGSLAVINQRGERGDSHRE